MNNVLITTVVQLDAGSNIYRTTIYLNRGLLNLRTAMAALFGSYCQAIRRRPCGVDVSEEESNR